MLLLVVAWNLECLLWFMCRYHGEGKIKERRKGLGWGGRRGWHGKTQHSQQFRNRRFGWCDRVCARGAEYKIARAGRSSHRGDENKKNLRKRFL